MQALAGHAGVLLIDQEPNNTSETAAETLMRRIVGFSFERLWTSRIRDNWIGGDERLQLSFVAAILLTRAAKVAPLVLILRSRAPQY